MSTVGLWSRWSVYSWKEKIKMRNKKDSEEEVCSKSTLKRLSWQRMVQGGEVFMVGTGSGSCEAAIQTEDWLSWIIEV